MKQVVIVLCEEWEGCYIDGELSTQNHSLNFNAIPWYEPIMFSVMHAMTYSIDRYLEENAGLPETLEEVCQLILSI